MSSPASLAIVARGPASQGQWKLEHVVPRSIRDDEVLVRVVASGICLADIHFGDVAVEEAGGNPAIWYPRVLGHEGRIRYTLFLHTAINSLMMTRDGNIL